MSRAELSLPISLSLIFFGVSQFFGGLLINRFGSRVIITLGVSLTGLAIFGMSYISTIWGIFFFYGIVLGWSGIGNSALRDRSADHDGGSRRGAGWPSPSPPPARAWANSS